MVVLLKRRDDLSSECWKRVLKVFGFRLDVLQEGFHQWLDQHSIHVESIQQYNRMYELNWYHVA